MARKRKLLNTPIEQLTYIEGTVIKVEKLLGYDGQVQYGKFRDKDGQPLPLEIIEIAEAGTGEIKKFWMNGGLVGALKIARVRPGDGREVAIELQDEKKEHPEWGTEMCQYNVYELGADDGQPDPEEPGPGPQGGPGSDATGPGATGTGVRTGKGWNPLSKAPRASGETDEAASAHGRSPIEQEKTHIADAVRDKHHKKAS